MALNSSGPISIGGTTVGQSINIELGLSPTANSSIGQTNFRTLAGKPTGVISLYDFYGKSNAATFNIDYDSTQYLVSPTSIPDYVPGSAKVVVNIATGVYLYSTGTSTAALTISGFVTGDQINIVNNGYIIGMGGRGASSPASATSGGPAISTNVNITIENNSYIGGGGGGGGTAYYAIQLFMGGGGGAGGGKGGDGANTTSGYTYPGGVGGAAGQQSPAQTNNGTTGGGRILPGVGGIGGINFDGYAGAAGSGGGGGALIVAGGMCSPGVPRINHMAGGGGGGWGASGGTGYVAQTCGTIKQTTAGSGGSGGAVGTNGLVEGRPLLNPDAGAVGGKAIELNGKAATITGSGVIYGAVS